MAKQLHLQRQRASVKIVGIGGQRALQTRGRVSIVLSSLHGSSDIEINAHVIQTISNDLPPAGMPLSLPEWTDINILELADPDFRVSRAIDIIIGADYYGHIIRSNIIRHSATSLVAQLSIFGWLILGPVSSTKSKSFRVHHVKTMTHDEELQTLITKFWVQEEIPSDVSLSTTPDEDECDAHFRKTHSRDEQGRYVVRLPLKLSSANLGESLPLAQRCLQRTVRRLRMDENYSRLYTNFMTEYEDLGHMVKSPHLAMHELPHYYLPHHGVLKPESTTTKHRVVFNGSSPTSSALSLNEIMYTGPNLLLNITDVLIWIRQHRYLFATDITKIYLQIRVHQDDWNLQRILWVNEDDIEVPYQLTTVTYGTKAAPFLAVRTLLQLVKDEGHKFPLAVTSLIKDRYVDDIFGGADTISELQEKETQLKDLCHAGGFLLAKWHSNNIALIRKERSNEDIATPVTLDDSATKILGLIWLPQGDRFQFTCHSSTRIKSMTKRHILSEVAQIFDPLGFISPVIIKAKMLLQELWLHKIGWDDTLPSQLLSKWSKIREELNSLASISVPRWLHTSKESKITIHGFSDASQLAMAAVVYITVNSPSTGQVTSLICAKTKVSPLKRLTIPRLELTAALILTKLTKYVQATLQANIENINLWTDSKVVLTWVKAHSSRWKDFVRNRVDQIQDILPSSQWKYVPGSQNPADCASRGITTSQLINHPTWWTGPSWLHEEMSSWPSQSPDDDQASNLEARPVVSLIAATPKIDYQWDLIHRYSYLMKLLRVTALCFRIHRRLKAKLENYPVINITTADLNHAKLFWIRATQAVFFSSELKTLRSGSTFNGNHPFNRLTAFIDNDGIIRVGGRLNNSLLNYSERHPAILPRHSALSSLIISFSHQRTFHGGTQLTLAHIRQQYWIIGGRAPVKSHVLRCIVCARQRGIRAQQLMGQLPLSRVSPSRPFTHTGIDYAGPFNIKSWKGRGSKAYSWICVFVCFSISAVHLEAVTDYSADGFIVAFRRFSSRRGIPSNVYSDCGTNFVGANKELKSLFTAGTREHQQVQEVISKDFSQWSFNPPAVPHMGGKWEAVVKLMKFHLNRTIGETLLSFEELCTLLTQIETILNSRPIEAMSDDPEDLTVLTPGHFLIGNALSTLPEPSFIERSMSRLTRWQLIQQKMQQFWSQWSTHYLQRLQSISKWYHPNNNIKVGSIVLLTDERLPPCKWPLAKVVNLHPSKDNLTRVVTIKTATTQLTRPISKLAVLPIPVTDEHRHNSGAGGRNVEN